MKILIISTFYPPLNSVASLRPYSWAKYWSQEGHDVTVLTTQKDRDLSLKFDVLPGVKVITVPVPTWIKKLKGQSQEQPASSAWKNKIKSWINRFRQRTGVLSACRLPDITHLWVKPGLHAVRTSGPWDLVISTSGPYTTHLIALSLKKQGLAQKWIADFRDLWVDNHIFKGLWPLTALERYLEGRIAIKADQMTTVSSDLAHQLRRRYRNIKISVIENGCDVDDFEALSKNPAFPQDNKLRIVYTGSVYAHQNPLPIFEALSQLSGASTTKTLLNFLEVLFVGPSRKRIDELVEKYNVSHCVISRDLVSREDALRMQRDANWLLFLPWTNSQHDGILTGKLFEYLCARKPIVCVGSKFLDAAQRLILQHNAGLCLENTEQVKLFLLNELSKKKRLKIQLNTEGLISSISRKRQASNLLELARSSCDNVGDFNHEK